MKNCAITFLRLLMMVMALVAMHGAQAALTINNDGTVTDPTTGLTWMRCSMGQTWDGSTCTGTASTYTFDKANALTGTVTFAGQSDWRMPNIRELQTIVDRSVYNTAIDSAAFPNAPRSNFWSGSPDASHSFYAWYVSFYDGYAYYGCNGDGICYGHRSSSLAVRLVRGGQTFAPLLGITRPTGDYVDNGNGTVTHTPTNLTWKRCAEGQTWTGSTCSGTASTYTFDQANTLTGTSFADQSDWRVPTEDELVSLVDYSVPAPHPTINSSVFPATPRSNFWSGSPDAIDSSLAWVVYFSNGNAYGDGRSDGDAVRLVRGGQSFGSLALTVGISGTGYGYVASSPSGILCFVPQPDINFAPDCKESYTSGTSVTLTATARTATGSTFTGWSGACSGTGSCTVSMTLAKSVTATFTPTAPVCTLSTSPSSFTVGGSSTLTASCSPAATSYTWTGGTCAGSTGATCTVTPTSTTTYSVTGTNAGGTGTAASATVTVNACTYGLGASSASVAAAASSGSVSVTSTCAWTATSDASWLTITSGASGSGNGSVTYTVAANTGTSARTGTLTIAGKTFTVTQAAGATVVTPPVCTLSATPPTINAGSISILTATCDPAASTNLDGYTWTGGTCTVTTGSTCTVTPSTATTYTVTGFNTVGTGNTASAVVRIAGSASSTVPGTLEDDFFLPSGNNSYYGGAGNDTYIISPSTLRGAVTAKIIDTEGTNIVQLVNGMTITSSSFFMDAAQLMLSNGAIVQVLGASKFIYQLGVDILAGETASNLNFAQFAAKLGASVPAAGAAAVSGTANFVVTKQ